MAWVSEFFFTKNPNLKKGEKYIFCFLCWGGRGGEVIFFLQRIEIYTFLFWGVGERGGGGMEGVVWRGGSVARVSEFF